MPVPEPAFISAEQIFRLPAMGMKISDAHLGQLLDDDVTIRRRTYATGGSINQCEILELDDGRRLFVKTHAGGTLQGMYAAEANALELLAAPGVIQTRKSADV